MANKLIAKPKQNKRELAKNRAGELKEKYTVEFSNDGSTYRLVDKKSGQVATETNAGVAYGNKSTRSRTNRLIGRELAKDNDFSSFKFGDEFIRRRSGTTSIAYNPANIKMQDIPMELPGEVTIDAPQVTEADFITTPVQSKPAEKTATKAPTTTKSITERFKTDLEILQKDLDYHGVINSKKIVEALSKDPKRLVSYISTRGDGTKNAEAVRMLVNESYFGSKPSIIKSTQSTVSPVKVTKDNWANPYEPKGKRLSIQVNKYDKVELDKSQPLFNFNWK